MRALGAVYEPGGLCPFARNTTESPGPPPHLLVQAVAPIAPALFRLFNITTLQRFTLHSPWHAYPSSTTALGLQFSHIVPQASHPAVTSGAGCGRITPNG